MHFVCKGGFLFYNNKKEEIKFSVLLSIGSFFEPKAPRQQLVNKKVLHFLNQSKENGAISLQINGASPYLEFPNGTSYSDTQMFWRVEIFDG